MMLLFRKKERKDMDILPAFIIGLNKKQGELYTTTSLIKFNIISIQLSPQKLLKCVRQEKEHGKEPRETQKWYISTLKRWHDCLSSYQDNIVNFVPC